MLFPTHGFDEEEAISGVADTAIVDVHLELVVLDHKK